MLFLLLMCLSCLIDRGLAKLVIRHDEVDLYDMERMDGVCELA